MSHELMFALNWVVVILLLGLAAFGARLAAEPGKILNPIYTAMVSWESKAKTSRGKLLRSLVTKPLLTCSTCMGTGWGGVGVLVIHRYVLPPVGIEFLPILALLTAASVSGVITILWVSHESREAELDRVRLSNEQMQSMRILQQNALLAQQHQQPNAA
jgi:hypothetical protein